MDPSSSICFFSSAAERLALNHRSLLKIRIFTFWNTQIYHFDFYSGFLHWICILKIVLKYSETGGINWQGICLVVGIWEFNMLLVCLFAVAQVWYLSSMLPRLQSATHHHPHCYTVICRLNCTNLRSVLVCMWQSVNWRVLRPSTRSSPRWPWGPRTTSPQKSSRPWRTGRASTGPSVTGGPWVFACMKCCTARLLSTQSHWWKPMGRSWTTRWADS